MILDLGTPKRRIDRNRDPARHQHAEERLEEVAARRQHDGDALARLQSEIEQARCSAARTAIEISIGNDPFLLVAHPQADVGARAMRADMGFECLEKRAGV